MLCFYIISTDKYLTKSLSKKIKIFKDVLEYSDDCFAKLKVKIECCTRLPFQKLL